MIDGIRNLLGDVSSGKIEDERILLLTDQLSVYERELSRLRDENASLLSENAGLRSQLAVLAAEKSKLESQAEEFRSELDDGGQPPGRLEDDCEKILKLFVDGAREVAVTQVASEFSLHQSVAQHHLDTLKEAGLVVWAQPRTIQMTFGSGGRTPRPIPYAITAKGRAYVVDHRLE